MVLVKKKITKDIIKIFLLCNCIIDYETFYYDSFILIFLIK